MWAGLGRIKMLASDFAGARKAIGFAWEEVPRGVELASWVEVEIRRVEAAVELHDGRLDLAAQALDRAVTLSYSLPLLDPVRAHTVHERLELATTSGDAANGLELSDVLEGLIEDGAAGLEQNEFWRAMVTYHRGKAQAAAGRYDLAATSWKQACAHLTADRATMDLPGVATYEAAVLDGFVVHEMARLAGRYYRNLEVYETLLRRALASYQLVRTPILIVTVEAELAALCALLGNPEESKRLAASTADYLDALPCHRRAWNAASRLRVLANGDVHPPAELANIMAELCDDLDSVRWEITGAQAAPAKAGAQG